LRSNYLSGLSLRFFPNALAAWFKRRLQLRVAGVDARRATPPDPRPPRWGLAGYCQLDPSHPAIVTCEGSDFEPCQILRLLRLLCEHSGLRLTEIDNRRGLEEETRHAEIVKQIQGEIEARTEGATDVLEEVSEDGAEPLSPRV